MLGVTNLNIPHAVSLASSHQPAHEPPASTSQSSATNVRSHPRPTRHAPDCPLWRCYGRSRRGVLVLVGEGGDGVDYGGFDGVAGCGCGRVIAEVVEGADDARDIGPWVERPSRVSFPCH